MGVILAHCPDEWANRATQEMGAYLGVNRSAGLQVQGRFLCEDSAKEQGLACLRLCIRGRKGYLGAVYQIPWCWVIGQFSGI